MADGTTAGDGNDGGAITEIVRPDALPESYWDTDAKAPKFDVLGKDLTELGTLRTERDTRVAAIPKDGKYAFDLPADYKVPEGMKWTVDENDPLAKGALAFAKEQGLTQPQFAAMARMWADIQVGELAAIKTEQTKAAEAAAAETKALGENAEGRRAAIKTWLGSDAVKASKEESALATQLLGSRHGVALFERMMTALAGVKTSGNPNNGAGETKAEQLAGKSGIELLRAANAETRG